MLRYGFFLLFLSSARTSELLDIKQNNNEAEFNTKFSFWPSMHNAANLMRLRRESDSSMTDVKVESGDIVPINTDTIAPTIGPVGNPASKDTKDVIKSETTPVPAIKGNNTIITNTTVPALNETKISNDTTIAKPAKQLDLNNPGVLKRGFIVFGGFALLAVAYFIFYRKKNSKNDSSNTHNSIDANQFRYGVLQSEDRHDKMELSRVPLTMESDDDEDEDLEIFDLEQKKKSLSYVNLQTNDEDLVFEGNSTAHSDRDNLLLDIEDGTSDTLINWSSNGSKSIL